MNGIQIFSSEEFGRIRVIEQDGEPWFVGKDVADTLEYEKIKSRERPKSKNRSLLFRSAAPQATKQKEKSTPYEFD